MSDPLLTRLELHDKTWGGDGPDGPPTRRGGDIVRINKSLTIAPGQVMFRGKAGGLNPQAIADAWRLAGVLRDTGQATPDISDAMKALGDLAVILQDDEAGNALRLVRGAIRALIGDGLAGEFEAE